jgi:type VI secretion system protein ImpE
MKAKELFDQGKLSAAVDALIAEVRAAPADVKLRTSLFEMLCFAGELDRALKQLEILSAQHADTGAASGAWKELIESEKRRREVLAGKAEPDLPQGQPEWAKAHVAALAARRAGNAAEAGRLLASAAEGRPKVAGKAHTASGEIAFADIRDGDDLLAPFLEVFGRGGRYIWLPFADIESVELSAPTRLRDLLFIPVKMSLRDGPLGEAYIPSVYPGSHAHPEDAVKLARTTDWVSDPAAPDGPVTGVGQHTLYLEAADGSGMTDRGILEIRKLEFAAK